MLRYWELLCRSPALEVMYVKGGGAEEKIVVLADDEWLVVVQVEMSIIFHHFPSCFMLYHFPFVYKYVPYVFVIFHHFPSFSIICPSFFHHFPSQGPKTFLWFPQLRQFQPGSMLTPLLEGMMLPNDFLHILFQPFQATGKTIGRWSQVRPNFQRGTTRLKFPWHALSAIPPWMREPPPSFTKMMRRLWRLWWSEAWNKITPWQSLNLSLGLTMIHPNSSEFQGFFDGLKSSQSSAIYL